MARNEEKAQSMLYRFREAQAAELGLGTRSDRRPRMASACKSLRDCERWRGEILREISRKVSKIQDGQCPHCNGASFKLICRNTAGLSDYEVRDLNDDINKLMREKRHWENQIVALGGANYRRNVAMLDDDGREVPGTKGYKYFGRAKELPGVRELFESRKKEEDEETATQSFFRRFTNQGPSYFGDLDEADGSLLQYEQDAEQEEWNEAYENLRETLGLPADEPIPKIPRSNVSHPSQTLPPSDPPPLSSDAKRKAPSDDNDEKDDNQNSDAAKRSKTDAVVPSTGSERRTADPTDVLVAHARAAAAYIQFLEPENLLPPKMPSKEEMEGVLLELRKRALVDEYFGN
ncbi:hypothetical protein HETIRDRAFT_421663 [Heterobasidion irregulare TC 32-1]|uniref:Pre-mRNA-splicing factor ISY1 n=1 Tax=Heterobasidion irregulare (strain TC 32-1) TaxID=747525 RepID=W4JWS3_HETIT|nr:uncharacterized protein HETIRDRAFT_421663 [Heterobasidion irregulare TC 32-1]ETW77540.1 hypothetical protein HETIRDRAFT_421663 [Heterobasidion irregulare TC 32-1]